MENIIFIMLGMHIGTIIIVGYCLSRIKRLEEASD